MLCLCPRCWWWSCQQSRSCPRSLKSFVLTVMSAVSGKHSGWVRSFLLNHWDIIWLSANICKQWELHSLQRTCTIMFLFIYLRGLGVSTEPCSTLKIISAFFKQCVYNVDFSQRLHLNSHTCIFVSLLASSWPFTILHITFCVISYFISVPVIFTLSVLYCICWQHYCTAIKKNL